MKQQSFFKRTTSTFGGSLVPGKRKNQRPLFTRKPIHFVLKCQKTIVLTKYKQTVWRLIQQQAKKKGIKIYSMSVQRDHVHVAMKIHNRQLYKGFVRAVTGLLARKWGKGLWIQRPFTRILEYGKDFKNVLLYIEQNEFEVLGLIAWQPRYFEMVKKTVSE